MRRPLGGGYSIIRITGCTPDERDNPRMAQRTQWHVERDRTTSGFDQLSKAGIGEALEIWGRCRSPMDGRVRRPGARGF